jgi:hypothetical protein
MYQRLKIIIDDKAKSNNYWLAALLLFSVYTQARPQAKLLDSIHQSGFIHLHYTELSAKVKTDFSDLRITDINHSRPCLLGGDIRILDHNSNCSC